MRVVALLVLLLPAAAAADDFVDANVVDPPPPAPRFAVGIEMVTYFPTLSTQSTGQPHQFGSLETTPILEIDAPFTFRLTSWLRAMALIGYTDLSLRGDNGCAQDAPCMSVMDQGALVVGAGGHAFHRFGNYEAFAELAFRAPIPIQGANTVFAMQSGDYNGQLGGGETIALAAGVARRIATTRLFLELGYLHSVAPLQAPALGLSASFGGALVVAGISLW
ncbi:MAG TPA: hypothetical protein VGG74_31680 [Kofleriaceae bacterium]|jgi:hypothetical protein